MHDPARPCGAGLSAVAPRARATTDTLPRSPPFKPNPLPTTYRFGRHRLDLRTRQLWCGDQPVPLRLKAWQVLLLLLQRAGPLVPAADLLDAV